MNNFGTRGSLRIAALFTFCWGAGGAAHAQVFVSDFNGGSVSEYSFSGAFQRTFVTAGSGGLSNPSNLTFGPDGNLYVAAYGNGAIKKYNGATGAYIGNVVTGVSSPLDVAFGADGFLYAPTYGGNSVIKVNATTGTVVQTYSVASRPAGIAFRPSGNLVVSSADGANAVELNTTTGTTTTFATGTGVTVGVAAGADGRFYFDDYAGGTIRVAPAAGGATSTFTTGGSLSQAQFLAFGNNSLYVGSYGNNTVQYFNATTGAFQGSFASNGATGIAIRGSAAPEPGTFALAALALPAIASGVLRRRGKGL